MTCFTARSRMRLALTMKLVLALALTGALVAWQLFVPPIIGLADQGDFLRLLGPLGFAPVPKGPEHKYWYVTRKFAQDPSYRQPRFEQVTSGLIIARAALALNRFLGNPRTFDVTLFGFIHGTLFMLALARLFYVTRALRLYWLVWALTLLVMTDVGYVAYWNSLYTEPASCLWFLFLLAESIDLREPSPQGPSTLQVLRWSIFALLCITARAPNAAFCLPLGVYGLSLARRCSDRQARFAAIGSVAAILIAGVLMYRSLLPATRVTAFYNAIFYGILPSSTNPRSDLKALGLDPDYVRYSGTLAWSEGTGVANGYLLNALQEKVNSLGMILFYLQRPEWSWRHVETMLPTYLSLRPEFCGNLDRSAGRPPGARSEAIAIWSRFHERGLARIGIPLLAALVLAIVGGGLTLILKRSLSVTVRRWTELAICLSACCLAAFGFAAFGDAYDNTKHQYMFNLLLDTCLVFGFVAAVHYQTALQVPTDPALAPAGHSY